MSDVRKFTVHNTYIHIHMHLLSVYVSIHMLSRYIIYTNFIISRKVLFGLLLNIAPEQDVCVVFGLWTLFATVRPPVQ
jgi:hypothetical protein